MRLYMTFRQTDGSAISAAKAAISTATAYRHEQDHRLPSSQKKPRSRRRPDPLVDFFVAEVVPMLIAAPGLRSVAIFEEMQRRHPDLSAGARRTLERRIRSWRAVHGADQEVIFRQVPEAGKCGVPTMETFAAGLAKDVDAIRAALTTPWSNGQTEGQVNRLKTIKRQMYGPASFDLLRRRVLLAARSTQSAGEPKIGDHRTMM